MILKLIDEGLEYLEEEIKDFKKDLETTHSKEFENYVFGRIRGLNTGVNVLEILKNEIRTRLK